MRKVFLTLALAFLASWAIAEWPQPTRRVYKGTVQRIHGDTLVIGSFGLRLRDVPILETNDGAPVVPHRIAEGQFVIVTLRCTPNTIPTCQPEKAKMLNDIRLR